ncbi:MAG: hypothetical protein WCI94_10715, partial [Rhodospirillales bacterium]
MPIAPVSTHFPVPHARAAASTGSAAARGASTSIANNGSVSADDMGSFFKSLSANLQATLSQRSGGSGQTAVNRPVSGMPNYHRHENE